MCASNKTMKGNKAFSYLFRTRHGPKFGRRRSSAEEFGQMFGSVRLGNMRLFGRSSAEPNFGKHSASLWLRIGGV